MMVDITKGLLYKQIVDGFSELIDRLYVECTVEENSKLANTTANDLKKLVNLSMKAISYTMYNSYIQDNPEHNEEVRRDMCSILDNALSYKMVETLKDLYGDSKFYRDTVETPLPSHLYTSYRMFMAKYNILCSIINNLQLYISKHGDIDSWKPEVTEVYSSNMMDGVIEGFVEGMEIVK